MFLISYEASLQKLLRCVRVLLLLFESKKTSHLTPLFNAVVLKRIWLRILIVTYKWDQRKSPDN